MPAYLTDEDEAVLNERGYITKNGNIYRTHLGKHIWKILESGHVVENPLPEEAARVGIVMEELLDELSLPRTEGLIRLMANMTTTSKDGAVQKHLPNGWVLGSSRAKRDGTFQRPDGTQYTKKVSMPVRWVTKEDSCIVALVLEPMLERQDSRAKKDNGFFAMIIQRHESLRELIRNEYLPQMTTRYDNGLRQNLVLEIDQANGVEPPYSSAEKQAAHDRFEEEQEQIWEPPPRVRSRRVR